MKAYFGESNIEIIDRLTSWKSIQIKFKNSEVARIQDLVEIANGKLLDSVEIMGESLNDVLSDAEANDHRKDLDYVAEAWKNIKAENIRYGVNVMFD